MGRRNNNRGRAKGKKKPNGAPKRKNNGKKKQSSTEGMIQQMGKPLENLLNPDPSLQGPPESERKYKWSKDKIRAFLSGGDWKDDDDSESEEIDAVADTSKAQWDQETVLSFVPEPESGTNPTEKQDDNSEDDKENEKTLSDIDFELERPLRPMPKPKPLESVFGGAATGSANSGAAGQTGLLSALLDPDAGGKGKNTDGIMGLIAAQQQKQKPQDKRAALRARLRYMRKQRGHKEAVYDARGKKIRGMVPVTSEDMMYGTQTRKGMIDKSKTTEFRNQMVDKMMKERQKEEVAV